MIGDTLTLSERSLLLLRNHVTNGFDSGLGLKEYLDFIVDVGMQPIMAVWSGVYHVFCSV